MTRRPSPLSPVRPLPKDPEGKRKPFRLGYVLQLPKLEEIPLTDWELDDNPVENQLSKADTLDDMCTAYALTSVLESQEGEALDPGYSFAKAKQLEGDWQSFGSNLQTIGDTARKFGALPVAKSPFSDRPRSFVANWGNWPAIYDAYASGHKQGAMLWVEGPYDYFDNIRATLWYLKTHPGRAGILAACFWPSEFQYAPGGLIPTTYNPTQFGHAFRIVGQKMVNGQPRLVIQNSYGREVGYQGKYFFPRSVVNKEFRPFGGLVFVDETPDEIRARKITVLQKLIRLYEAVIYLLSPAPVPKAEPAPMPEPSRPMPTLHDLGKAIEWKENVRKDLNNPGALRWSPFQSGSYKQKLTGLPLATFATYEEGFKALIHQLRLVSTGKSPAYNAKARELMLPSCAEMNLAQFFRVYAPSGDHNDPDLYARQVATRLGVDIDFRMKNFT